MPYKITIQKIGTEKYMSKDWEARWTDATFKNEILPEFRKNKKPGQEDLEQYGYASTEKTREVNRTIYEQTVDGEILLKTVIDAFNHPLA